MPKKGGLELEDDIFKEDFIDRVFKERELANIPIKDIVVEPQPRKIFQGIDELAYSIEKLGLLQPVVVMPKGHGRYLLIAGERRLKACQKLGWSTIPARIVKGLSQEDIRAIQLVENIQREELKISEKAAAISKYLSKFSEGEDVYKLLVNIVSGRKVPEKFVSTVETLSRLLGKSVRTIARWVSVMKFPPWFVEKLDDPESHLSLKHAEVLLSVAGDEDILRKLVKEVEEKKLSSEELRKRLKEEKEDFKKLEKRIESLFKELRNLPEEYKELFRSKLVSFLESF